MEVRNDEFPHCKSLKQLIKLLPKHIIHLWCHCVLAVPPEWLKMKKMKWMVQRKIRRFTLNMMQLNDDVTLSYTTIHWTRGNEYTNVRNQNYYHCAIIDVSAYWRLPKRSLHIILGIHNTDTYLWNAPCSSLPITCHVLMEVGKWITNCCTGIWQPWVHTYIQSIRQIMATQGAHNNRKENWLVRMLSVMW